MVRKRRGRPAGKRKERDPVISARIPKDVLKSLDDLAKQRGLVPSAQTRSAEVRRGLAFWVHCQGARRHNSRLGIAIAMLADLVEEYTGKSWVDHSMTRQVVREHVQELVFHLLSPLSKKSVAIPADIKEEAGQVLAVLKRAMAPPRFPETLILNDPRLVMIAQELGDRRVETRPELVEWRKQDNQAWGDAVRADAFADYLRRPVVKAPGRRLVALEKQKGRK
jgi:hypothetical protein